VIRALKFCKLAKSIATVVECDAVFSEKYCLISVTGVICYFHICLICVHRNEFSCLGPYYKKWVTSKIEGQDNYRSVLW
jgi:hypothetical protein